MVAINPMDPTPSHRALARAIPFLRAAQRPSGELPAYTASRPDMADARAYPCCVYVTTFVVHALWPLADDPVAAQIRADAGAFLRAEREPNGAWCYEGRATRRVPPDMDDTACAMAALLTLGERPDLAFYQLLWENEAAPGGPYYTWLGVNSGEHLLARQIDALVNANLLLCAALAGLELPGTAAYLSDLIIGGRLADASDYCLTPHLLVYALGRLIARQKAEGRGQTPTAQLPRPAPTPAAPLSPALPALLAAARSLRAENPFQHACRAAALLALGDRAGAEPDIAALIGAQQPDGGWPIAAAYSGYPPHLDGSPALTTAIAVDALALWGLGGA